MQILAFETRLCKPRHPFTKGKVERLIRFVKDSFLADRVFCNLTGLNWQVLEWCDKQNENTTALWTVYLKRFVKLYAENSCT